ncbi:unnamed protein product [Prorocentrum cordatum]|uniref:Uncharacterized protein n=1 Tax=Prorocentrum cordatum TaxID=2364126 RepID=A0ABN9TSE6_9DINO|nr:unnamed protein product [Polarella glacialis]
MSKSARVPLGVCMCVCVLPFFSRLAVSIIPGHFSSGPRLAWALSYIADDTRLLGLREDAKLELMEDAVSFEDWIGDVPPGAVVDHPLVPLVPAAAPVQRGAP